ncbi:hypothetical protein [Rhodococcus sp. Q]|uniref:hypothetical protein n=1 Tax=Rhodococcus sp. Q TaxID=2502252 RepID=UPI0010F8D51F|nr:hypothetical protein [Rhodococcus sp. Q]
MGKNVARLAVAAALFGGVLAVGGGTASAAEDPPVFGSANGDLYLGSTAGGCLGQGQCFEYSYGVLETLFGETPFSS